MGHSRSYNVIQGHLLWLTSDNLKSPQQLDRVNLIAEPASVSYFSRI